MNSIRIYSNLAKKLFVKRSPEQLIHFKYF